MNSDDSIVSSRLGESLSMLPCCVYTFMRRNLKCSRACPADDGETTIHTAFAESSPSDLKSKIPFILRSPYSPQMVYFPEKPSLSLAESSATKHKIREHKNATIKETTTDEESHHSEILHSEHIHSSFQIVGGDVLDGSDHGSILNSGHLRDTSPTRDRHTSMAAIETMGRIQHPLRRSIKRLKMNSEALKSWSMGLTDESSSPLLNPNAIHRERTLDMHFEDDCSVQENIDTGVSVTGDKTKLKSKSLRFTDCSSPLQVLIPSFPFHRREKCPNDADFFKRHTTLGRQEKPPLPRSGSSKTARTVRFRFS
jgi:hypothetical protein